MFHGDSVVVWWDNRGIGDVPRLPRTIVAQIDFFFIVLVPSPRKG